MNESEQTLAVVRRVFAAFAAHREFSAAIRAISPENRQVPTGPGAPNPVPQRSGVAHGTQGGGRA